MVKPVVCGWRIDRVALIVLVGGTLVLGMPLERYCPYQSVDGQAMMAKYWTLASVEMAGWMTCDDVLRQWGVETEDEDPDDRGVVEDQPGGGC